MTTQLNPSGFRQIPGFDKLTTSDKKKIWSNLVKDGELVKIERDFNTRRIYVHYLDQGKEKRYSFFMAGTHTGNRRSL